MVIQIFPIFLSLLQFSLQPKSCRALYLLLSSYSYLIQINRNNAASLEKQTKNILNMIPLAAGMAWSPQLPCVSSLMLNFKPDHILIMMACFNGIHSLKKTAGDNLHMHVHKCHSLVISILKASFETLGFLKSVLAFLLAWYSGFSRDCSQ